MRKEINDAIVNFNKADHNLTIAYEHLIAKIKDIIDLIYITAGHKPPSEISLDYYGCRENCFDLFEYLENYDVEEDFEDTITYNDCFDEKPLIINGFNYSAEIPTWFLFADNKRIRKHLLKEIEIGKTTKRKVDK